MKNYRTSYNTAISQELLDKSFWKFVALKEKQKEAQ